MSREGWWRDRCGNDVGDGKLPTPDSGVWTLEISGLTAIFSRCHTKLSLPLQHQDSSVPETGLPGNSPHPQAHQTWDISKCSDMANNDSTSSSPASVVDSGYARWPTHACRWRHVGSTIVSRASRGRRRRVKQRYLRKEWLGPEQLCMRDRTIAGVQEYHC